MANQILLVEDDPDGGRVMARLLSLKGFEVRVERKATSALAALADGQCIGAIIDIGLPGESGFDLLEYIRQDPRFSDLPCIAITAYRNHDIEIELRESSFAAYFYKPVDTHKLLESVIQLFGGR